MMKHHLKRLFIIIVFAFLFTFIAPDLNAAETTQIIDGSFTSTGYNNEVYIEPQLIFLYEIEMTSPGTDLTDSSDDVFRTTATTDLTPQNNYYVQFDVEDLDTFTNLAIEFQLVYTDETDEAQLKTDMIANTNTEVTHFFVSWTLEGGFVFDSNNTSWDFDMEYYNDGTNAFSYQSYTEPNGTDDITKTFRIYFSPSKVAPFDLTGNWVAGIVAYDYLEYDDHDDATNPDWSHKSESYPLSTDNVTLESKLGYTMQWYGEVQITPNSEIVWPDVFPGMDFTDSEAEANFTDITYISNSTYYQTVKASELWRQSNGNVVEDATLRTSFSTNPNNEFKLQVFAEGLWYDANAATPGFIVTKTVTPEQAAVNHLDSDWIGNVYYDKTGEDGVSGDLYLRLSLSEDFQDGDYSGTITLGITNVAG
jgi:hypothetical protein